MTPIKNVAFYICEDIYVDMASTVHLPSFCFVSLHEKFQVMTCFYEKSTTDDSEKTKYIHCTQALTRAGWDQRGGLLVKNTSRLCLILSTWGITIVCNSSSRISDVLFLLQKVTSVFITHRHTCRDNTHICKSKTNLDSILYILGGLHISLYNFDI